MKYIKLFESIKPSNKEEIVLCPSGEVLFISSYQLDMICEFYPKLSINWDVKLEIWKLLDKDKKEILKYLN